MSTERGYMRTEAHGGNILEQEFTEERRTFIISRDDYEENHVFIRLPMQDGSISSPLDRAPALDG